MLIVAFGVVLTTALLVGALHRVGSQTMDLGSMSHHWLAAHQASQPASSM
jgi:hypothetical protein